MEPQALLDYPQALLDYWEQRSQGMASPQVIWGHEIHEVVGL
jgi:hypothetical protein